MPTDTALHKASHTGDMKKIKTILENGEIDVDSPGASERRALHRAAGANHLEACEFLISKGATIDIVDKTGRTPLHWACISGHVNLASFLIRKGSNIFEKNASQMNPLHMCAENGSPDLASILLEKAGEKRTDLFDAKNKEGHTPFLLAKANKHNNVIKVLKLHGDPNAGSSMICPCS